MRSSLLRFIAAILLGCLLPGMAFAEIAPVATDSNGKPLFASEADAEEHIRCNYNLSCANQMRVCEVCIEETGDCYFVVVPKNAPCPDTVSLGGSIIDNIGANHIHQALDYCYGEDKGAGCTSCGGESRAYYDLPTLQVRRSHRYRENWAPSTFGPGAFAQWDSFVQLSRTKSDGSGTLKVLDISQSGQFTMKETGLGDNSVDGLYRQSSWGGLRYARLVNASEQTVIDQHDAAYIDMHSHDGAIFRFEIIRISTDPASNTRFGRPLRWTDRNGNGYTINYLHPANASDADLSFSRERLRIISSVVDAYGQTATLTYKSTQVAGRWVCERIDLPNGEHLTYTYDAERLIQVDHPDGTVSTITRGYSTTAEHYTVTYDDAASDGTHRRKTAYHTVGPWIDPIDPSVLVNQSGNRIRMIINAEGEVAYMRMENPANPEQLAIYEGGQHWRQHRTVSFQPNHDSTAVTLDWDTAPAGVNGKERYENFMATLMGNSDWELTYSYQSNTQRQVTRTTDAIGRQRFYSVDPALGRSASTTHYDGTIEYFYYDEWNDVTRHVDRLGRVTTYDRDTNGNILVKTIGLALVDPTDPAGAVATTTATSVWRWDYNARGQVVRAYDALYDAAFPDLHVTEFFYDVNGDPTAVDPSTTDPATTSGYLVAVREAADVTGGTRAVTTMSYDAAGNMFAQTDAVNRTTTFGYDERNRVTSITYADGSTDTVTYGRPDNGRAVDANLVISSTDRNGNVEDRTYDTVGRLQTVTTAANDPSISIVTSHTYLDGNNRRDSTTSAGDTTTTNYDYRLRPVSRTGTPRAGDALTSLTLYDGVRRAFGREDAYGRRSYTAYNVDNDPVRSVTELVPGAVDAALSLMGDLPNNTQLLSLTRDVGDNPAYLIEDRVFDSEDQLLRSVDPRGVTSDFLYDQQGRRTQADVATGQIAAGATAAQIAAYDGSVFTAETNTSVTARSQTIYDAQSNVIRVIHPREFDTSDAVGGQFRTAMAYTGRNLLASRTEAEGRAEVATEFFAYHPDRTQASRTDFRGNATTIGYEPCCQRVRVTIDPTGAATVVDYDDFGNVTYQVTLESYDPAMFDTCCNGTTISAPDAETVAESTTRYDARHRPIARTQWLTPLTTAVDPTDPPIAGLDGVALADGLTTFYAYDDNAADGLSLVFPDGTTVPYAIDLSPLGLGIDADGAAMAMANPEGEVTVTIVDGMGRTVLQTDGEGNWVRTELDVMVAAHTDATAVDGTVVAGAPGELLQVTVVDELVRGLGYRQRMVSNAVGQTLQVTDAEGNTSQVAFDAQGNRTKIVDANGIGESCLFDLRGRDVQCADTQGDITSRVYNVDSQVVESTDALNSVSTARFDGRGRQVQTTDRVTGVTIFGYDDNSNLTQLIDAEGGITAYGYDPRNLLEREEFPTHQAGTNPGDAGNDARTYTYDALRRLTERVDQLGQATGYDYDLASRLERRTYFDDLDDVFVYDRASRLTSATSQRYDVVITRVYNDDSTLDSETTTIDGVSYPVTHSYDVANRMIGCVYPSGSAVAKTWTDRDQLETATFTSSATSLPVTVSSSTYDAGMREISRVYGNSITTDFRYNLTRGDNLVEQIAAAGVVDLSYTYDANKRKKTVTDAIPAMAGFSQTFDYDADDRLTDWTRNNGVADGLTLTADQGWTLSLVGDWDQTILDGISQVRSHNDVHEITTIDGQSLTHDAKGNLTADTTGNSYAWDVENRLQTAYATADGSGGLANGLLLHWALDATSGTTAVDLAGTPANGTVTGAATWLPATGGRLAGGLDFDGTSTQVSEATVLPSQLNGLSAITIGLWVRSDVTLEDRGIFFGQAPNGADNKLGLRYDKQGWAGGGADLIKASIETTGGWTQIESPSNLQTTDWQHITLTWESGQPLRMFIDGAAVTPVATVGTTAPVGTVSGVQELLLGIGTKNQAWLGAMDELRVYDRVLSATEIAALASPNAYRYDALGRRVQKAAGDAVTTFICAGPQVVAEYDTVTGLASEYVYGSYVDEPLIVSDASGDLSYYHRDRRYSVHAITDAAGAVAERYGYDAFGDSIVLSADGLTEQVSASQPYRTTGRRFDDETGLHYYRMRQFDAGIGQFISRDLLGYVDGMSMYRGYFAPLYVDPMGLQCEVDLFIHIGSTPLTYSGITIPNNFTTLNMPLSGTDFASIVQTAIQAAGECCIRSLVLAQHGGNYFFRFGEEGNYFDELDAGRVLGRYADQLSETGSEATRPRDVQAQSMLDSLMSLRSEWCDSQSGFSLLQCGPADNVYSEGDYERRIFILEALSILTGVRVSSPLDWLHGWEAALIPLDRVLGGGNDQNWHTSPPPGMTPTGGADRASLPPGMVAGSIQHQLYAIESWKWNVQGD